MYYIEELDLFYLTIRDDFHLIWDVEANQCVYGNSHCEERATFLPLLSFDAPLEKIKLYLLFS